METKILLKIEHFPLIAKLVILDPRSSVQNAYCCPSCGRRHRTICYPAAWFQCEKCDKAISSCHTLQTDDGPIQAFRCSSCSTNYRIFRTDKEHQSLKVITKDK
jgi:hypothetical protein